MYKAHLRHLHEKFFHLQEFGLWHRLQRWKLDRSRTSLTWMIWLCLGSSVHPSNTWPISGIATLLASCIQSTWLTQRFIDLIHDKSSKSCRATATTTRNASDSETVIGQIHFLDSPESDFGEKAAFRKGKTEKKNIFFEQSKFEILISSSSSDLNRLGFSLPYPQLWTYTPNGTPPHFPSTRSGSGLRLASRSCFQRHSPGAGGNPEETSMTAGGKVGCNSLACKA